VALRFKKISVLFLCLVASCTAKAQLNANFTASNSEGCELLSGVVFTPTGNPSITSWNWSFGNGNSSQLQNPSASYPSTGRFTVSLTVSDGTISQTITKSDYIKIYSNPTANFTFSPSGGCSPLPVNFLSTSTLGDAPITSYSWDFKDGSPSTNQANVSHTYQVRGNYTPSLLISDSNGCTSTIVLGPLNVTESPVAEFTTSGSRSACTDSLIVTFANTSTGVNLNHLWDFGDATTSTLRNPTHTFRGYGAFTVSLTVTDPNCSSTKTELNYIRLRKPNANFTLNGSRFCVGEILPIIDNSSDVDTYLWNFGDGTGSTSRIPNKSYSDSGTFIISLTVFAPGCSDMQSDTIRIEKVIADFTVDTFSCNNGDIIQFFDQSYNAVQWKWRIERNTNFSNKFFTTYSDQNPIHTYGSANGILSDSLIVTSANGCKDTIVKNAYRIFEKVQVQIVDDTGKIYRDQINGCTPQTFDINSTISGPIQAGSYAYTWSLLNGQTFNGSNPPQDILIQDDSSRTIAVNVISSNGCIASDSIIINLGSQIPPQVSYFPTSLCYADTLFLVNTSPNDTTPNFIAYIIENVNSSARDSVTPRPSPSQINDTLIFTEFPDTGYYNLRVRYGYNGCDSVMEIDSAFYVRGPVIQTDFSSRCFQDRNSVDFAAIIKGATRFSWDFGDGTPLDSVNLIVTHTYNSLISYKAIFTAYNDSNGCALVTDTLNIILNPAPTPIIRPDNPNICLNEEVLVWQNSFARLDSIQWFVDGIEVGQRDSFLYTFDQRKVYEIRYLAKDEVGCLYTRTKDFSVTKPQASFSYALQSNCLPVDIKITNTSVFNDSLINNYFLMGSGDTLFSPDSIYTYTTAGNKSITLYIENEFGCSDTLIQPNLFNLQPFNVAIRTLSNNDICVGRRIIFRNVSSDRNNAFIWDFADGDTVYTNRDTITHVFDSAGIFNVKLRGEDANGCVKFDSVRFTVEENPIAGFTADTTISNCYPLEVQFQDTSSGNITDWFWQIGTNFSVLDTPRFIFEKIGKYDVSLRVTTANGCTDSVFKSQYIQTNGPEATFSIDKDRGCVNEPFTFTLTSQNNVSNYEWDFGDGNSQIGGPTATHAYRKTGKIYVSLSLTDTSGIPCGVVLDSILISEVLADFTMTSDTGCVPHASTFINTSLGATTLSWDFGQGSTSAQQQETINYTSAGTYFVRLAITSNVGCIDTLINPLHIFETPVALVSGDTGMCIGQTIQLSASGGVSYVWSPDSFMDNNTIPNPIVNPNNNTRYLVTVTNPSTCFDTASIFVRVIQKPGSFLLLDSTLIIGETYQLNANVGNHFNYSWTPPDGLSCTDCPNPIATPLQNTTYYLFVYDDFGCFTIRDTIEILVEEKYSLDVPKAFSPNNDGVNDVIYARGWGLKQLIAFRVYNRFGEQVFESTDFANGWDGKYRNKEQNIETYIYTVEALTFGNKVLTKTGNISLLR
jgi:gliding motility-associated-like protein